MLAIGFIPVPFHSVVFQKWTALEYRTVGVAVTQFLVQSMQIRYSSSRL